MRAIASFFVSEFKRFFSKRNIILVLIIWILAMVFVQIGSNDYKFNLNRKEIFQKFEQEKVRKFINYTQYGTYGFRMQFIPHSISILFNNSGVIQDMTSFADSGERLNIYQSLKGKNIFAQKKFPFTDFSGIILFFGSLLVLLYGFDVFRKKEYLKTLASMSNSRQIFFPLLFARIAVIFFLILVLMVSAMAIILVNGLTPPININLFWFLLLLFAVLVFFFIIGTVISTCKSQGKAIAILFITWFILLFVIQAALNNYIASKANNITLVEQLEMAKLNILSDFEKKAIENSLTYKYGEKLTQPVKDAVLNYLDNEFKRIQLLEDNMIGEMKKVIFFHQILSIFFPTTNYFSVGNEISSMGYFNLLDFYQYVQDSKEKFVKFYIDKLYFSDLSKFPKVVSFVKGDENIFKGKIYLPTPFPWGFLVIFLQIMGLTIWSYARFKKLLYSLPEEDASQNLEKKISFSKGNFDIYFDDTFIYSHILYISFSGNSCELINKGFTGSITVDNEEVINMDLDKDRMFYLCNPQEFPNDMKAQDFINFFAAFLGISKTKKKALKYEYLTRKDMTKPIGKLQAHQKGELFFSIIQMKKSNIYLLGDACKKMPYEFVCRFKKTMETLAEDGSLVIFLNSELDFPVYRPIGSPLLLPKAKHWKQHVDNLEEKLNDR